MMEFLRTLKDADLLRILYADGYGGNPLTEDLCRRLEEATDSDELTELQEENDRLEGETAELESEVRRLNRSLYRLENELLRLKESHAQEVADLKEAVRDAVAGTTVLVY